LLERSKGKGSLPLSYFAYIGCQTTDAIPFTSGTNKPSVPAPAFACDCHFHIYDARFPAAPNASINPPDALVPDYLRLRARLGIERSVIVTPSTYGTDNSCTLDAIARLGESARGVAVVNTSVTDEELKHLDCQGIRGIRFNIARAGATTVEMIEPLARRIADLGWHIQVHMPADEIARNAQLLRGLPVPMVFDHLGRIPQPQGTDHPAYGFILKMLCDGRAWIKISSLYQDTRVGPPAYADLAQIAQSYIKVAPERVLWGSDWPHPSKGAYGTPDDALLFDLAAEWAGNAATWKQILVHNPEVLYGFPKAT
jgi:predicted TIM-barrel fold metal-dependent hydrolase